MTEIVIEERFAGPPGSANGGYFSGAVSHLVDGIAEVTIRTPPPLATPLHASTEEGRAVVMHDDKLVAEVASGDVDVEVPELPSFDEAERGERAYLDMGSYGYAERCFVCGPLREPGDGLRVFTGIVPERELMAGIWSPDPSVADAEGRVYEEVVWAALDCPGNWAPLVMDAGPEVVWMLGRLTGSVLRPVHVGERLGAIGWPIRRDGRKLHTGSALFDENGAVVGITKQTCILLR